MILYGYCRVSSKKQELKGSLVKQKQVLMKKGVEDKNMFSEVGKSDKTDNPKLFLLLRIMQDGDCLVVTNIDRLTRNTFWD